MHRRGFLKNAMAAAAASAIPLSSIRAEDGKTSVTVALPLEPPTLDPTMQPANAVGQVTLYNIFETLTSMDENGKLLPLLAESWENQDSRVYTFKLVKGVTFHDGSPFTSADVKFTFERNASEKSTNKRKRIFVNMASIETPDDYTVRISLKNPSRLLPAYLAEATGCIVSSKSAETNGTKPVGTGPYAFENWVRGDSITMKKFPKHRNASTARIETATMRFIADANAQLNALLSGGVDWIPGFQALEAIDRIKKNSAFTVTSGTSTHVLFIAFNNKQAPLNDVRVRRALSHAIDRKQIIDGALYGFGTPVGSQMTPAYAEYTDLTGVYPYDPEKAQKLLAEAGHGSGMKLSLKVPPSSVYQRSAEIAAAMWAQVGVQVNLELMEWAQWLDVVFRRKAYDLAIVSQPEPWTIYNYTDPNYFYQYTNAEFDQLCQKAEASTTDADFKQNIQAALKKLADDAATCWMSELPMINVMSAKLHGVRVKAPIAVYEIDKLSFS